MHAAILDYAACCLGPCYLLLVLLTTGSTSVYSTVREVPAVGREQVDAVGAGVVMFMIKTVVLLIE